MEEVGGGAERRFAAPRLAPDVVERPRLLAALGERRAPLTVVRAPAGSGKSTLVAQWLDRFPPDGAVLWHTSDEPGGSRAGHWHDVLAALARNGLIPRTSAQHWSQGLSEPRIIRRAVRSALEEVGSPITLVLDDFGPPGRHWDAIANDLLGLLEALPQLSVVAVGRAPTPLEDVAAAVTVGTTLVLGDALRLDAAEAAAVAAARGLPDLGAPRIEELLVSSDRLLLPYRFALETLLRTPDRFPADGWIEGYGRALVGRLESEGLLEFAGAIAQAPYATGELAADLSGRRDAAELLTALEHAGVGTISIDHEGEETFRFTGEARELVAEAFRRSRPEAVRPVLARIARWLGEQGAGAAAIEYALRADDLGYASERLALHTGGVSAGEGARLHALLSGIDRRRFRRHPTVGLAFAMLCRLRGDDVVAAELFAAVALGARERAVGASATDRFLLGGQEAVALRMLGRYRSAMAAAKRLLAAADDLSDAERLELGAAYPRLLGHAAVTALYAGDLADARIAFERQFEWSLRFGCRGPLSAASSALAFVDVLEGRIADAELRLRRIGTAEWPLAWSDGQQSAFAALARSGVARERGDIAAALAELDVLDAQLPTFEHWGFVAVARSLAIAADGAAPLAIAELDRAIAERGARSSRAALAAFRIEEAREHLAALAGEPIGAGRADAPAAGATALSIRAVREALAGRVLRASELLARADVLRTSAAADLAVAVAGVVVTRRVAGDSIPIGDFVARLGAIVAANGVVGPLALLPAEDRDAVLAGVEHPEHAALLGGVFARYAAHAVGPGASVELTAREQAVLEALVATASRAELAGRLHVSVNTVKSQLRTLYRKLGVGERDAALLRAVELGLLDLRRAPAGRSMR